MRQRLAVSPVRIVPVGGHASFNKMSGVADDDLWASGGGI
jgi:hypothetical protein